MRLVVCLFAESRQLLPVNDPIYAQSYGVRSLYELLEEAIRNEGGVHTPVQPEHGLAPADGPVPADPRRLGTPVSSSREPTAGCCSGPATPDSADPVARALHILEHAVPVGDATIYAVLRKLLRGRCR